MGYYLSLTHCIEGVSFLARDVGEGRPIEEADLEYKRPGNIGGIGAEEYNEVIGLWSQRNLKKGSVLQREDLSEGGVV